ncbi:hypothetical protein RHGRI_007719 [Rhododendron griersonianum]|uniref:CCHC-type domain-containing protein n=1 Tax=Rhododendron griersonianum TaxID=479676 RepID=A0AAV6KYK2_9ERIC|nr:hypothetical protein RHGRI_007719 [Rhododendron griersonianum]
MQTLWTVSEAYNRALVAEKQEKRKFFRSGQQNQGGSPSGQPFYTSFQGGSSSNGSQVGPPGFNDQNRGDKASSLAQNQPQSGVSGARKQAQSGGFKCFKCGEPGHKSSDCRKASGSRNKALFSEVEKSYDDIPLYDDVACEEIGGDLEEELLKEDDIVFGQELTMREEFGNDFEDFPFYDEYLDDDEGFKDVEQVVKEP